MRPHADTNVLADRDARIIGAADCGPFLPESDVRAAVGVDIGQPTSLGDFTALSFACVWADAGWSLQGGG